MPSAAELAISRPTPSDDDFSRAGLRRDSWRVSRPTVTEISSVRLCFAVAALYVIQKNNNIIPAGSHGERAGKIHERTYGDSEQAY